MAKLKFNNGVVEDYTIVLSTRDYRHLGQLTGVKSVHYSANLNSPNELSFSLMKTECSLWEQVVDLKLIWIKELNEYFEIKVSTTDSLEASKCITGTSLCEAELSQIYFSAEINTESDISRDDYEITRFYDENHPKASLLHRVLDKVPYYKIKFVDSSLQTRQRTFCVSSSSIYDFLVGECSEHFNCLFVFDSSDRSISAYDLDHYGRDTTILVDKDNLTDTIQLETNTDNVKNCFKLIAGDDYMTSTIRILNPNGSDYIYYVSESQRKDMPDELKECLRAYDTLVKDNTEQYQQLISCDDEENLGIYQLTDKIIDLESGMMPKIEHMEVTATKEVTKLTQTALGSLGLLEVTNATTTETVNSALKNYAKVYIKTGYVKLEIDPNATFEYVGKDENIGHYGTWYGRFIVTNSSNKEDVAHSDYMTIIVHDNYEAFVKQKMLKAMSHDDDDNSIFDVLSIETLNEFQATLKLYCKKRLESFYDAIQSALDVLIQLDQASESADLYDSLYQPYYERLLTCQAEIDVRNSQIDELQKQLDERELKRAGIQKKLDFRTCLGEYYDTFLSYTREDTYSNDNYISDGLSNAEMIEKANEFIEIAQKELYKSGEQQVSISATLYNLLTMNAFKPIVDDFELGNWIRVKVDENIYKLQLLGYSINFDNLQSLDVQFSNVTKLKDTDFQAKQVLQSAKSIATTYSYVSKQAEKGNAAYSNIQQSLQDGLNVAKTQITNNADEEIVFDKHGILCRSKDDITGQYDPKQVKLTHNALAFTDNAWQSVRQVVGEHSYSEYDEDSNSWTLHTGYGITSDFSQASQVSGCTIVGGQIYSENYSNGTNDKKPMGTHINLIDGHFSFGGGNLVYDGENLIISSKAVGESLQDVNIKAENLRIDAANIDGAIRADSVDAENLTGTTIRGKVFEDGSLFIGNKENTYTEITKEGILNCNGFATLNGDIVTSFGCHNVSLESEQKNIEYLDTGLDIINHIDIYKYHYKTESDESKKHIGLVIGDNYNYTQDVTSEDNTSVNIYTLASVCVKAIQELETEIKKLQTEIEILKQE